MVIKKITEETAWREGSTKAVLLIADAAPHKVGYSYKGIISNAQIDWREEAKKASELGIKFDTMTIDPMYIEWYKELSAMTNGVSEDRVLRGYKMQFVSRDGKYKCMDMDVVRGPKETGERLVNINTISQLVYNGVKYVVE